ncbi:MAG TPA: hypothetical protein VD994_13645, partial [Prosthecobacter sp.]|nr:hypothetical protein [Prosthecobacter sp.]
MIPDTRKRTLNAPECRRSGPEVEPLLGEILRASGEFARFDREETATPEGLPVIYPPTPASAETLRHLPD